MQTVLSDSQVVLATCHSAGGRQLWNQNFDVVIIDEATQAIEAVSAQTVVAMVRLRRTGLLGADFQSQEVDSGW